MNSLTKHDLTILCRAVNSQLEVFGKTDRLEIAFEGRKASLQRVTPNRFGGDKVYIVQPDTYRVVNAYLIGFITSLTF